MTDGPTPPELPTGRIRLAEPPRLPTADGVGGVATSAVPMLGSLGSVVLVASLGGGSSQVRVVAAGLFLLTTVAYLGIQLDRQRGQRRRQLATLRREYLRQLGAARAAVREAAAGQRRALTSLHPAPPALPALAADGTRVWERTTDHPAFLHVRYGVAAQPLCVEIVAPADLDADDADPAAVTAVRRFLETHRTQADLPVALDLRRHDRIALVGDRADARGVARALVCSAAAFHAPDQLAVAVVAAEDALGDWEWVKWLPHAHSTRRADAVAPARLVGTSLSEVADLLPSASHLLLVLDGAADGGRAQPGVTVVEVGGSGETTPSDALRLPGPDGARLDSCGRATAEALARRLLPRGTAGAGSGTPPVAAAGLPDLLGVGSETFDPTTGWRPRPERERLRVPIGIDPEGAPVHLDLKESAQLGVGPHGLLVGATGSGKSELLRTLVLGLALTHPPDDLNFVLVDFKGGATFAGMAELPHVSAVITNLTGELALVDRMNDAVAGEMVRRQEVLRAAGNLASVRDYARARDHGAELPPLPSLMVVVDEFSELLTERPELTELFVAIGRLGRSLGLHLLLASQRLEEGRLRGLESHLSYRMALRTFSAPESRAVLGVPDAYELPAVPGVGYLRAGPTTLIRFRAAHVSAPPPAAVVGRRGRSTSLLLPFTAREVSPAAGPDRPADPVADPADRPSVLDLAVGRMRGRGTAAHRIWLPPLDRPDPVEALLPAASGPLRVPVGRLDRPREQRCDPLVLDLQGAGGHVAVVGGSRSGKSTLLRTILAATALTSSPLDVHWFVLDLGSGGFGPLGDLLHVAGHATRTEEDVARRIVAEIRHIQDRREAYFRERGIDSIDTYRRLRRDGAADDGYGDVFLCVDGWGGLRTDFESLEPAVQQIAERGLGLGVHLVASSSRWSDFRGALRDQLGTRLELRLGDPVDSEVDRRTAATVPPDRPGRGLVPGPLHFLAALPPEPASLVATVSAAWQGARPPRLRLLPASVGLDVVRRQAGAAEKGLLLGLDETRLAPVRLDPGAEPHLLVFGDSGSGKSGLLRTYLREVARALTPARAQVVLVDPRRALLGEVSDEQLLHYLTSADQARPAIEELASYLRSRLPGRDVTPEQLRRRSWWSGAEVFVVVDDYDLVSSSAGSPLSSLQPLLAQAGDVGLRLVVARRSGGAARALHEPVIQTLRDLAAPGVLLSGSTDEGPLLGGVRAVPAAPGRARLVTRDQGVGVVQVAWSPPRL